MSGASLWGRIARRLHKGRGAHGTAGTAADEEFVGRASDDESGDASLSGGEARAGRRGPEDEGALRDTDE